MFIMQPQSLWNHTTGKVFLFVKETKKGICMNLLSYLSFVFVMRNHILFKLILTMYYVISTKFLLIFLWRHFHFQTLWTFLMRLQWLITTRMDTSTNKIIHTLQKWISHPIHTIIHQTNYSLIFTLRELKGRLSNQTSMMVELCRTFRVFSG